jgi:Peptidase M15
MQLTAELMQLTADFSLEEFTSSTTADRLGIDNTPTAFEIDNLRTLCVQILQPARSALGPIIVHSGFRSAALNTAVGGVPDSAHRLGFAADIVPLNAGKLELAKWIRHNTQFDQLILEFGTLQNPNWIHVSADPKRRMEVLRAFGHPTQYVPINI